MPMWPTPSDTQSLLNQARAGDAAAAEELLACHREPVRRLTDDAAGANAFVQSGQEHRSVTAQRNAEAAKTFGIYFRPAGQKVCGPEVIPDDKSWPRQTRQRQRLGQGRLLGSALLIQPIGSAVCRP